VPRVAIRRTADDFRVDEELEPAYLDALDASASDAAPHAVCRLTKTDWTTPDACDALAYMLRLRPGAVSWAGLKDRHAVTAQHISVERPSPAVARSLAQGVEGPGWRVRTVGWGTEPIDAAAIRANAFEITVRGLRAQEAELMRTRAERLRAGDALVLVNYFGDQRFGSARHGKGFAARSLIAGNPLGALRLLVGTPARKDQGMQRAFTRLCAERWGDWAALAVGLPACADRRPFERLAAGATPEEAFLAVRPFLRSMCIESYQSLLWNDGARRMVRALGGDAIEAADDFGALVFPLPASVPPAWFGCRPPMPGPDMAFVAPWGDAWREALVAEGLEPAKLVVPGIPELRFGHAERPLVVRAESFAIEPDVADSMEPGARAVAVRFTLPRGAYATVLLRALGQ
jgi:tRNA pseudouridine13 synthase